MEFLKKRFFKIYIPYIIVVAISALLPWMYDATDTIYAFLSHLFLFKMVVPKYEGSFGNQLWFISTIIQFYLFFIPMCHFKERNEKVFLPVCFGTSILWWIFAFLLNKTDIRTWNSFFLQYIWEFALGMHMAGKNYEGNTVLIKKSHLVIGAVLGIGIQTAMALAEPKLHVFNDVPAFFGYICLSLLLYNIPVVKRLCIELSAYSYEIYLVHILIFKTGFFWLGPEKVISQIVVGTGLFFVSMIIAYGYKQFISKGKYVLQNHIGRLPMCKE